MMAAVLPTPLADIARRQLATFEPSAWDTMTERQRDTALMRQKLILPVLASMDQGLSVRLAAQVVTARAEAGSVPMDYALIWRQAAPSAHTLESWARQFQRRGLNGLADQRKGRQRKDYGWESRAAVLYRKPERPSYATVAYWLRKDGYDSATESRVRRYLKSLPANLADAAPARVGQHYYDQNMRPHHRRGLDDVMIGEVWQGDGHRCDVYVQHPISGSHFRPELWIWLDLKSKRVLGWWMADDESGETVMYSFSDAIRRTGHMPVWAHSDKGPGFRAKEMSDKLLGFFARFSINPREAIAGNAKGKGLVEGWFRWFEERCGKVFPTFCGHCRTDDALSRFETKVRRGEIRVPTWHEYKDAVAEYIEDYNAHAMDSLGGKSPNDVWADLEPNPLHLPEDVLLRPQRQCTARRWEVRLNNRYYRAAELKAYERRKVLVEYDLHDESMVWVRDEQQRLVCIAHLVGKTRWATESVMEDKREKSRRGRIQRLERKQAEIEARFKPVLPAAQRAEISQDAYEALAEEIHTEALEAPTESPTERFSRALRLQAADDISAEDARWLANYQQSPEYHSRLSLHEEFGGNEFMTEE